MTLFYLGFYAQLWGVNSSVLKAMWPKFANGQKMSLASDKRWAETCGRLPYKIKEYLKSLFYVVTVFKNNNSLSWNSRQLQYGDASSIGEKSFEATRKIFNLHIFY